MQRHALPLALIALLIVIELLLTGADLRLWGQTNWRARAFVAFSFQPNLWVKGWEFWPGQRFGMLVTHIFLHVGFLHMVGNVLSLALLLRLLGWMQSWGFLMVGLLSALGGALAFWALAPAGASMTGTSGAISGLAAFWVIRRSGQNPVRWKAVAALAVLLLILIGLEIMPGISTAWQAHLGGAVVGVVLAPTRARLWGGTSTDS